MVAVQKRRGLQAVLPTKMSGIAAAVCEILADGMHNSRKDIEIALSCRNVAVGAHTVAGAIASVRRNGGCLPCYVDHYNIAPPPDFLLEAEERGLRYCLQRLRNMRGHSVYYGKNGKVMRKMDSVSCARFVKMANSREKAVAALEGSGL